MKGRRTHAHVCVCVVLFVTLGEDPRVSWKMENYGRKVHFWEGICFTIPLFPNIGGWSKFSLDDSLHF